MPFVFGDSFDLYAVSADLIAGYWDSGTITSLTFSAGRFAGSQALNTSVISQFVAKNSGSNDAAHHLIVAFRQTSAISGSTTGSGLQLGDGATAQCSITFRQDGAIILRSGSMTGTVLATYTGAFPVINTWYAFEIEVVINNTTGSFTVRKDGAGSDSFSATGLNTRGGTANNYANRLTVGLSQNSTIIQHFDDLFWRSDASSVAWLGDIRCYTRMPASDAAVQFSRSTGATNFGCVDEAQQNTTTDYVFDSTPAHADFYGVGSIASTPAATYMVTTRGYMQKSDSGSRTAAVQLKSGASTVASSTLTLTTSGWQWAWRSDIVDPATSAAWTPVAVNGVTIGPTVIA